MNRTTLRVLLPAALMALLPLLPASSACANGYGDAADAYKAQMKREDPTLINGDHIGNLAASQAKRVALQAVRGVEGDLREDERRSAGSASGGDVGSPRIYGTVRGNVTIVTVRGGGRRGSLTSVRR